LEPLLHSGLQLTDGDEGRRGVCEQSNVALRVLGELATEPPEVQQQEPHAMHVAAELPQ
jgi:hypothetical protein